MLTAYPTGRKAALIVSIVVAVFYVMTLLQALGWSDGERFLTQLIVAPFSVALLGGIAFAAGALFDVLSPGTQETSSAPSPLSPHHAGNSATDAESGRSDPFTQAGREVLSGEVLPELWARSLAAAGSNELAVKAEYVRLRVAQLMAFDAPLNFTDEELDVYGPRQLEELARVLREGKPDSMHAVRHAICRKIGRDAAAHADRPYLEAYYEQLHTRLNACAPTPPSPTLA